MEKDALPMMFYLNDGDTDKTGYQKLKQRAVFKAIKFHSSDHKITIGPEAAKKTYDRKYKEEHCFLSKMNSPSESRRRVFRGEQGIVVSFDTSESPEQNEEKFIRKRILASLEHMCLLESQEKVWNMRKEWMKREADTNARLQDELDEKIQSWKEGRMKELLATNSVDFDMSIPDEIDSLNLIQNLESEKDQKNVDSQYSLTNTQEINRRKECLAEISSQHSKLHHISSEISKCLKFDNVKFRSMIASELDFLKIITQEFSHLIENCEQKTLSQEDLNRARDIVINAQKIYECIKEKAEKIKLEIEEEKKREEEKKKRAEIIKELEDQKQKVEGEISRKPKELVATTMEEDMQPSENKLLSNPGSNKINPEIPPDPETSRILSVTTHFKKYFKVLNDATILLKDFMADDSLKKFRSECQKAVNVPVNAISAVSAAHLNDKLKKLHSLLSGKQVLINSKPFNPTQHPLGIKFCTYLLAEKIVSQGQDVVSVKPDAAFPIALVVLALWGDFPQFGDLLMAVFHRVCPYLIPIYWIKEEGMSDDDYYRKLGFKYSGGEREDINMFLKREGGVVRLYFSIIISHMKDSSKPHPLDLHEAWRWLAMFTSLEPSAEITATLLFDMLDVTGHALKKTYEKQFFKLIHLICVQYLPKIEKATPAGKGGPVSRLKSFLEQLIRSQSVKPPKGLIPLSFW